MNAVRKFYNACLAIAAGIVLTVAISLPVSAASHGHHGKHPAVHVHATAHARALIQREQRLAERKHEAKLARIEAAHRKSPAYRAHLRRQAAQQHQARIEAKRENSPKLRAHLKRLALKEHEARLEALRIAEHKLEVHNKRLARLKVHVRIDHLRTVKASAHAERLARIAQQRENQARYQAHMDNIVAARQAHWRHEQEAHEARLAAHYARLAEHSARLAQQRAKAAGAGSGKPP